MKNVGEKKRKLQMKALKFVPKWNLFLWSYNGYINIVSLPAMQRTAGVIFSDLLFKLHVGVGVTGQISVY